jgi:hypothetical protein
MKSIGSRLTSCLAVVGVLVMGAGCQGAITEGELAAETGLQMTEQAATEEQRNPADIIAGLEASQGILHAEERSADIALGQLKAVRVDASTYEATDELTGDTTRFQIKLYPADSFIRLWKWCPTLGQYILYWYECPTVLTSTSTTIVWKNSSCSRKIQSASWGVCSNNSSGGSNRYYYLEAWKCGVGTGYCVERRAAKTMRFNYDLANCNADMLLSASTTSYDMLCKAKAPVICR